MEQISFFLEKFKTIGQNSNTTIHSFINIVEKLLNVKILKKNIKEKDGILYIKAHPTLKSELYMKREKILAELSKILGNTSTTKIH